MVRICNDFVQEAVENIGIKYLEFGTNMAQEENITYLKSTELIENKDFAGVAQTVEQRIRNAQVRGSTPLSSYINKKYRRNYKKSFAKNIQ